MMGPRGKYMQEKYKMENTGDHVTGLLAGVGTKYPQLLIREVGEKEDAHLKRFWGQLMKHYSKSIKEAIHRK